MERFLLPCFVLAIGFLTLALGASSCDYTRGRWVRSNATVRAYDVSTCLRDRNVRCALNGKSREWLSWRWKPESCSLPPFSARKFLHYLRGKSMAMVGDSITRNMYDSLLCLLAHHPGVQVHRHPDYYSSRFPEFHAQIDYRSVPYFTAYQRPSPPGSPMNVFLDRVDPHLASLQKYHVVVFSNGHWFHHRNAFFHNGAPVADPAAAAAMAVRRLRSFLEEARFPGVVMWRSLVPAHFSGGDWDSGGSCMYPLRAGAQQLLMASNRTKQDLLLARVMDEEWRGTSLKHFRTINVTGSSALRHDAHPALYGFSATKGLPALDCSHWCLPGVPDTWNQVMQHVMIEQIEKWMRSRMGQLQKLAHAGGPVGQLRYGFNGMHSFDANLKQPPSAALGDKFGLGYSSKYNGASEDTRDVMRKVSEKIRAVSDTRTPHSAAAIASRQYLI